MQLFFPYYVCFVKSSLPTCMASYNGEFPVRHLHMYLPPSFRVWQWQLGAIAVFLGWLNLIIFIRKFPLTGIYVVMFVDIFYTFCRLFFLSLLLVIAFGLAFYMAFNEPKFEVSYPLITRVQLCVQYVYIHVPVFLCACVTNT